ncbi:hypothetical protein DFR41_11550 [Pseudacidovorax intermedius]|uniref:Polymerase nucleotidyl transferase domain-containing protein n=1 Tax=Pseudacidovorax intermedius TaxID=433924 RepID=A0A370F4C5_9BURK|nr:hypothetical protein [Pseudacidovorax intermedius]RDI18134.1 hypothetical protein DFR41_11550 [Pseudacidovorax intermedius]
MGRYQEIFHSHSALQQRIKSSRELLEKVRKNVSEKSACKAPGVCIYAAGSLARYETGKVSDLDLFFVADRRKRKKGERSLSKLSEVKIFSDLIRLTDELQIQPFSGDGKFLKIHELQDIIEGTGSSDDDSENLFTTRLLLLLESKCIVGQKVYDNSIRKVLDMYFRDGRGRKEFRPLFLLNDILRYWRTLCLNYERTRSEQGKPWWKKNLNLKFPRKLTVFSTVLCIVALDMHTLEDFLKISSMTPLERLIFALDHMADSELEGSFLEVLNYYEDFLAAKSYEQLNQPDQVQLGEFSAKAQKLDDFFHSALASTKLNQELVRYVLI